MANIEDKIKDLIDKNVITLQYGLKWANAMDMIEGWKQAAEHGESPTLGPEWLATQQNFKDKRDAFIDHLPLFLDSHMFAVIDLVTSNNQLLIELMKQMIQESKKAI
jgi:hypothetical protein